MVLYSGELSEKLKVESKPYSDSVALYSFQNFNVLIIWWSQKIEYGKIIGVFFFFFFKDFQVRGNLTPLKSLWEWFGGLCLSAVYYNKNKIKQELWCVYSGDW